MGKGDRTTRRGKLFAGTYGNTRPRKKVSPASKGQEKAAEEKK